MMEKEKKVIVVLMLTWIPDQLFERIELCD